MDMVDIQKLSKSFQYAFEGIAHAFKNDQNLRIHFVIGLIVIIVSILLRVNSFEKGILGITILFVICAEMINSAIEQMVDLISTEHRKEAKIAKDVAAGMVLLTAVGSVIIGILIFTPYLLTLFI